MDKTNAPTPDATLAERTQRLADLDAVNQALIRQCRSLDAHDIDAFLAQFDDEFSYSYDGFVVTDREKLRKAATKRWQELPKTTHLLGNVIVDLVRGGPEGAEEQAVATSDCLALTVSKDGAMDLVTAAYRDRLVKRGGEWRICERVIETRGPFALGQAPK